MAATNEPNLWDQRENETDKSYATFLLYRNMGKGERSLEAVAEMTRGKISVKHRERTLQNWSSNWQWVKRCKAWDAHQQEIADEADQEAYTKSRIAARKARRKVSNNILAMLDKQITFAYENNDTKELVRLSTALARILEQSRQEFNDLPTQRSELSGPDGGPVEIGITPIDYRNAVQQLRPDDDD